MEITINQQKRPDKKETPATPPADTKPKENVEVVEPLTEAQLEKNRSEMLQVHGFVPQTKEVADAEEREAKRKKQEPAAEPVVAPVVEKPAEKPAEKPPVTPAAPAKKKLNQEELIRKTAEETAKETAKQLKQEPTAPAAPTNVVALKPLSPEDQRDYEAMLHLAKKDPKKYAGKAEEFVQFARQTYDYRAKWESENPGKSFEPDSDEHEEFFKKQPDVDTTELDEAHEDIKFQKRYEQVSKPITDELRQAKIDKTLAEKRGTHMTSVIDSVSTLIKDLGMPEVEAILLDNKGLPIVTEEALQKMEEYDPYLKGKLEQKSTELIDIINEVERFTDPDLKKLGYIFSPQQNPIHHRIASIAIDSENFLLSAPPERQIRDGKQFVSAAQYRDLITAAKGDQAKIEAVLARNWTFSPADLKQLSIGAIATEIKEDFSRMENYAKSREERKGRSTAGGKPAAPNAPTIEKPAESRPKPPTVAAPSDSVDTGASRKATPPSFGETAVQTHWS